MLEPFKTRVPLPDFVRVLCERTFLLFWKVALESSVAPVPTLKTVFRMLMLAFVPDWTIEVFCVTATVPLNWNEPKSGMAPPLALIVPPFRVRLPKLLKKPFDEIVPPFKTKLAAVGTPALPQVSLLAKATSAPAPTVTLPWNQNPELKPGR